MFRDGGDPTSFGLLIKTGALAFDRLRRKSVASSVRDRLRVAHDPVI